MNRNSGAPVSAFRGLPCLPSAPVPTHQPFWEPPVTSTGHAPISQVNPLVLSAFPTAPVAAGAGFPGPGLGGPLNFCQHGSQQRPAGHPYIGSMAHTQVPLILSAPGAFCGGAEHAAPFLVPPADPFLGPAPAPFLMAAPALRTTVAASASAGTGYYQDHRQLGLPRPAPPPFLQLVPITCPTSAGPWPQGAHGEGGLPTIQPAVLPDDTSRPQSVYEEFRRWQHFKTLVRRHLPETPDVEALSCFLLPVLRSLSRLEPSMTVEEGLWKGLKEWEDRSNFDRMIFYETAEKFVEFEAAEEMEDPWLQRGGGFQSRPPQGPLTLHPPRTLAPDIAQQPACNSRKTRPKSRPARSSAAKNKVPPHTKAPKEIPEEAVKEYIDIMDELVGPTTFATSEPPRFFLKENDGSVEEDGEEETITMDDLYPDPSLLDYVDKEFVTKVESMIHPRFLEELLSPHGLIDIMALLKELEKEEELSPEQVVETRLMPHEETRGAQVPDSPGVCHPDSATSRLSAGPAAHGVIIENCPPEMASQDVTSCRATDPRLGAKQTRHHPQARRSSCLSQGHKMGAGPRRTTSSQGPCGMTHSVSVDEDLRSLDFLLTCQNRLLPPGLAQSPGPHVGTLRPGRQEPQAPPPQRRGLNSHAPQASKVKKGGLPRGSGYVERMPYTGGPLQLCAGQEVTLGLVGTSQPQKKKSEQPGPQGKRKRY